MFQNRKGIAWVIILELLGSEQKVQLFLVTGCILCIDMIHMKHGEKYMQQLLQLGQAFLNFLVKFAQSSFATINYNI